MSNSDNSSTPIAVTAGVSKGSTVFTVADSTGFSVGNVVVITIEDDSSIPIINVEGIPNNVQQRAIITSVDSTHIHFYPALYDDFGAGSLNVTVFTVANGFRHNLTGMEDFLIDGEGYFNDNGVGAAHGIEFVGTINCWAKGVTIQNFGNYPFFCDGGANGNVHLEIRRCKVGAVLVPGLSNQGGILLNTSSACLIEDNISLAFWEVNQATGNVISRNYIGAEMDVNHNAGTGLNLYEGNQLVTGDFKQDGFFGTAYKDTLFRNATDETMSLKRFTRSYAVIGNFLVPSNISGGNNQDSVWPSEHWQRRFQRNSRLRRWRPVA